jgi:hypothetical protein
MVASAAGAHFAGQGVAAGMPNGELNNNQSEYILLLLILCAVIVFIQHDRTGEPQSGTQYAAIGVVGFVLLVLAQFWPELAFTFTVLFFVSIVLNSPNGVPLISSSTSSSSTSDSFGGVAIPNTVAGSAPESAANAASPSSGGSIATGDSLHP